MIKYITRAAVTLCFLLTLIVTVVTSAHAQSTGSQFKGYIPFSFNLGGDTFPSGQYVIERINRQTTEEVLSVKSIDGSRSVLVRTSPIIAKKQPVGTRLVFHCYGETRFLSQLLGIDDGIGLQFPKVHLERALEREERKRGKDMVGGALSKRAAEYQTVAVLLRQR